LFVRYSDPMLANEIMALIFGTAELQVLSACARRRLGVWACMCRLYLGAALAPAVVRRLLPIISLHAGMGFVACLFAALHG
jgi:hypothetical protein